MDQLDDDSVHEIFAKLDYDDIRSLELTCKTVCLVFPVDILLILSSFIALPVRMRSGRNNASTVILCSLVRC